MLALVNAPASYLCSHSLAHIVTLVAPVPFACTPYTQQCLILPYGRHFEGPRCAHSLFNATTVPRLHEVNLNTSATVPSRAK